MVIRSVATLHRDENIHFLPERWLDGDEEMLSRRLNQLILFGYGGRVYLGKALANTMEIKLLIPELYRKDEPVMTKTSTHASMRQYTYIVHMTLYHGG